MSQPGQQGPRDALDRVERLLISARSKVDEGERDGALQDADDAYVSCDEIGGYAERSLKPLIDNVRKDLPSDSSTDKTVRIEIDSALAEVGNVRRSL